MTDSRLGSSSFLSAGTDSNSADIRPRNRRLASKNNLNNENGDDSTAEGRGGLLAQAKSSSALFSSFSAANSRTASPIASARSSAAQETRSASNPPTNRGPKSPTGDALEILENSFTQGWTSFQGFASSLLSGEPASSRSSSRNGRPAALQRDYSTQSMRKAPGAWGPAPPEARPSANDIGAGSLAERDAALKAARMASVLESHEGVNGGLDVAGRYKRRTSDDFSASANANAQDEPPEDQLAYIHHVQPSDTYAGIVLKYRCREDAFRKLNGLWTRDILWRKWLALPVDFCEVKGKACDPPSDLNNARLDHLAPTPDPSVTLQNSTTTSSSKTDGNPANDDDFFSLPRASSVKGAAKAEEPEEKPWVHVRWCSLDNFNHPVEIARVSKRTIGYFPPRRKKSIRTVSSLSTPRQSLDMPSGAATGTVSSEGFAQSPDRPGAASSRRQSMLSGRHARSASNSSRSRVGSIENDHRPAWMRRPGGVGSMGRSIRAPGPERDALNTWATRHLPGIAIDEHLPSISVMGSETAHLGFDKHAETDPAGIVESPFDEGQDTTSTANQGSGLDRAAMQVETWLRGAFAKKPGTPIMGARGGDRSTPANLDLIEMADTNSEGGRSSNTGGVAAGSGGLLDQATPTVASSGWAAAGENSGSIRGRATVENYLGGTKGKKSD